MVPEVIYPVTMRRR